MASSSDYKVVSLERSFSGPSTAGGTLSVLQEDITFARNTDNMLLIGDVRFNCGYLCLDQVFNGETNPATFASDDSSANIKGVLVGAFGGTEFVSQPLVIHGWSPDTEFFMFNRETRNFNRRLVGDVFSFFFTCFVNNLRPLEFYQIWVRVEFSYKLL